MIVQAVGDRRRLAARLAPLATVIAFSPPGSTVTRQAVDEVHFRDTATVNKDARFYGNGVQAKSCRKTQFSKGRGFLTVTDLNDFNGPAQTTNLGVRSSNLFGRANQY